MPEERTHMGIIKRFCKPSAGRKLLQGALGSFGTLTLLVHNGEGKQLLVDWEGHFFGDGPEEGVTYAEANGMQFIRKCILDIRIKPTWDPGGSIFANLFEEYLDQDMYRVRLLLGIALIDAVRANNKSDEVMIDRIIDDIGNGITHRTAKQQYDTKYDHHEQYAEIVTLLNQSDLYID